ncbi:MAG TPA: T9SS type A sorting domain-containing protein [Bacteroidales bacterium]|nr:T9SS type A sorting domain-containing protein [Bacteroidales bacterium]
MKQKIFTLLFCCVFGLAYAQDASDFGAKDVLIVNFEDKNPIVTDSLWTDTLETTAVTTPSANISLADNPFPVENTSAKVAKYVLPKGGWKSIYIRFNQSIVLAETPNLQVQIYPIAGKSPKTSKVYLKLINDKGEVTSIGGSKEQIPQDEWTTVTAFLGKQKSSIKYNAIEITINADDSLSNLGGTEYYIDQIGFKAMADGSVLPSTIFNETFGSYIGEWAAGTVPGQRTIPYLDNGVTKYEGPGEIGTSAAYASVGGFTSGIPFTFRDIAADTAAIFVARGYGMKAKDNFQGYSGGGRIQFRPTLAGTLATGNIDVTGFSNLNLSFGIGTQEWWAYNSDIANARPKVEISVNGGAFYEIYSISEFLKATGNKGQFDWGTPDEYEDQIFTLVEYPLTTIEGAPLPTANTINIHISYKSGTKFWIDDLWFSGRYATGLINSKMENTFNVYPNPAKSYILTPGAQKVIITDLNGRAVINTENTEKVSVASLSQGIYFVQVTNKGVTKVGKLVKE